MKKYAVVLLGLLLVGCSYEGRNLESYVYDPASIIQDPHFADYKEKRDALESQYLRKELSYADYKKQVEELDNKYNKEVQTRETKMEQN